MSEKDWKQEIIEKTWKWYQDNDIWNEVNCSDDDATEAFTEYALNLAEEHFNKTEANRLANQGQRMQTIDQLKEKIARLEAEKDKVYSLVAEKESAIEDRDCKIEKMKMKWFTELETKLNEQRQAKEER